MSVTWPLACSWVVLLTSVDNMLHLYKSTVLFMFFLLHQLKKTRGITPRTEKNSNLACLLWSLSLYINIYWFEECVHGTQLTPPLFQYVSKNIIPCSSEVHHQVPINNLQRSPLRHLPRLQLLRHLWRCHILLVYG